MPKYQPSKYYADDKDVHDILSSVKISPKKLLSLCRQRGIFLSEECTREEVVHYMSMLPFDWNQIQEVMAEVEREDREEKLTTCKVKTDVSIEAVEEAIQKVRDSRGEICNETYDVTQTIDGKLHVKIAYTEPDFQRARLIQRREKEAVLEIERKGDNFEVRHTQNDKTNDFFNAVLSTMTPPDASEKPLRRTIELSGIKSHEQRTKFFLNLFGEMEGFQLREVKDLKVDRITTEDVAHLPGSDEDELKISKETLKCLVRKVALTGENILVSPQYQQLTRDGFFISKAIWTSMETIGAGRLFEFEAEFKNPENASDFAYQVRGVYDRDHDGELLQTRSQVSETDKNRLRSCLESTAYESVAKVTTTSGA